jgi:hypothetical protein
MSHVAGELFQKCSGTILHNGSKLDKDLLEIDCGIHGIIGDI